MGEIILILAAVIEMALGVYCIATKSNQKRIRSLIRISVFSAFIIFTLVSVIQWSFRWYLLSVVLLIPAVNGIVSLVRKKDDRKNYRAVRVVFESLFTWIIIAAAVIPALIFPQFKLPAMTGKYKVATAVFTYTDNSRTETFKGTGSRRVNVEFWYPEDADGRYPLVVFSHGAFGVKASNTSTFMNLASNGYVVCSIDHPYHSMYTRYSDGSSAMADRSFIQEVLDANNGVYDDADVYELEQKWLKLRVDDMNFVIDTIIKNTEENKSGRVYQLIDTEKIGLFGHSLGGAASAKLGRERKDIDAVINLDADLLGEEVGFVDGKPVINKEIYPVPMLGIYSETMKDLMASAAAANPDVVIPQKLISATAPDSFEVYFTGTNHMSLTDLPLVSPFLVNMINGSVRKADNNHEADAYQVIQKMNSIILEFFNCYLKGEGNFRSITGSHITYNLF